MCPYAEMRAVCTCCALDGEVAPQQPTAAPVMSPPVAAMVKSTGSISQVPLLPLGRAVVTLASSAI